MYTTKEISFISVENQNRDFPIHFHETFCISLIRNGIEKMELDNQFLYSEVNCISITNPYEVHANPLADAESRVSFDTIYLTPDLMTSILNGKGIEFQNRQIHDIHLTGSFIRLFDQLKDNDQRTEHVLTDFIRQLSSYARTLPDEKTSGFHSEYLTELLIYIEQNLENKLYLDELARITHLNPFGFAKKFKSLTGMTPMSYVLMKKVFSAKARITPDCDLTDLAYTYSFTDMAHFSNSFKKYVGVSPREYRNLLSGKLSRLYK